MEVQSQQSSQEWYSISKKISLYKTEMCRSFDETGFCRYGNKCQFAHNENELRQISRHPRYKTETCKTFWEQGFCPYGRRCCFIHTDNPDMKPNNQEGEGLMTPSNSKNNLGQASSLPLNLFSRRNSEPATFEKVIKRPERRESAETVRLRFIVDYLSAKDYNRC